MRVPHLVLIAGLMAIPSAGQSQDSGLVTGRVGQDASTSTTSAVPSVGFQGGYARPLDFGPRAGFAGAVTPGQVLPRNVPVMIRPDGSGAAIVNGHRVIVGPNSDRIVRVVQ
jgi:hypothetical protein